MKKMNFQNISSEHKVMQTFFPSVYLVQLENALQYD